MFGDLAVAFGEERSERVEVMRAQGSANRSAIEASAACAVLASKGAAPTSAAPVIIVQRRMRTSVAAAARRAF
jgi:hypothetical protein